MSPIILYSMPTNKNPSPWFAFAVVGQLGYMIAIPAVLFGFGGAYLDKYLGTSPIFLIIGLSLAFLTSAFAVRRLIQQVLSGETASTRASQTPSDQTK